MQIKQASALVVVPTTVFASSGRKTNQIALGWCCGVFRWCGPSPMAAEPSYCNCRVTSKGLCHIYLGLNFHLACFHLAPMHKIHEKRACTYFNKTKHSYGFMRERAAAKIQARVRGHLQEQVPSSVPLQNSLPLAINFPRVMRMPRDHSIFWRWSQFYPLPITDLSLPWLWPS